MKYSEASHGRVFVIRLEDGDVLHESLEAFAAEHGVRSAGVIAVGGADAGSVLVVGPERGDALPVVPMERVLAGVHEIAGTGTIFPNARGEPVLHMHLACGREGETTTGCARRGVKIWKVMEILLFEITGTTATRVADPATGFELLEP